MEKISNWEKFKLLFWKNWVLQWNHKWQLLIELLVPITFTLLLLVVRSLVNVEQKGVTTFNAVNISNLELFNEEIAHVIEKVPVYKILYSPQNSFLDKIIQDAAGSLKLQGGYEAYPNSAALQFALSSGNYLAGIQFDDSLASITEYPKKFSYAVRFPSELRTARLVSATTWQTHTLFPIFGTPGPRNPEDADGGIPVGYLREGFLPVQQAVTTSFLKLASSNVVLPEVMMQRYPYPPYIEDNLIEGLGNLMAMILLLSFIYPCTTITKNITTEKEKQLKEVMKIMGLSNWIHWVAWFVKAFIMLAISAAVMTLLITIKWSEDVAVLTYSSWSVLYFFFLIFIIASICFCFMIATFFSKASTAAAVAGLLWFIAFLPYSFADLNYGELTLGTKLGWCLLSNSAMGFGLKVVLAFEGTGEGLQWSNFFSPISIDDNLTFGYVILMMIASCFIYMIICLYIEQIFPGDYGVPKKWYFPFTAKFWCGDKAYAGVDDLVKHHMDRSNPDVFEVEPSGKHIGLQVKNLKKKFGDKMVVKGLSVNMYEDEITVLLGHNGAGKTTTISMLTGMFPPTSGTAIINGSDIRSNIEGARMSLGICPQHNVLFDDLSVANHIVFFSRLKGLKGEAIKREVDKYLGMIELTGKANVASSKLSGGMKRKLSVCCALCGDTKVVLCDEPSSGMDPSARRQLWDLLQTEKTGRTILLTTHFMDEADVLGDRIAIMCDGELKCHGTSFFLKKKYGSGYHLICVKQENCNVAEVTALLRRYIPDIQPESDIGAELSYQLPDRYSHVFENTFAVLENESSALNLDGYGISITTMEEVFMKVGSENANDGKRKDHNAIMNGGSGFAEDDAETVQYDRNFSDNARLISGTNLFLSQWKAMFLKKMLYTFRKKIMFLVQNIMPIFFVIVTILMARSQGTFNQLEPMTISLQQYPNAVVSLEESTSVETGSFASNVAEEYKKIISSYGSDYSLESTDGQSFTDYILDLGSTIQVRINSRYLAAATVANNSITAWLNNQPLHTAPLTVNLVHNAMAKVLLGSEAEVTVTNAPLPYTLDNILTQLNSGNNLGTQLALNLCFCMCFVSSFYLLFVIAERQSRSKLLQFVGGVRVWTFWLTQFLWDLFTFTFTALLVIATLACFQEEGFASFTELARYFLILFVFGITMLPFSYLMGYFFIEPATGFARMSIVNIFIGMALFIVYIVMSSGIFDTKQAADAIQAIFRLYPHFALALGLNKMYINDATRNACSSDIISAMTEEERCQLAPKCCTTTPFFAWDEPGVLPEIVYMCITAVIFFTIIIISEYGLINEFMYKMRSKMSKPPPPSKNAERDDDVERERTRILNMSSNELSLQNLVLDRVTKYYEKFMAVNQISLCVKETECFGLLGVNGAGKTTTFKMMTGDERITYGAVYIKGMNLKREMNEIYKEIGYCPQFDALLDDLTGREILKIFCLLRGIQKERINQISEELAKSFGFMKHLDKETKAYSGGNKRKLSTAIAVIGSPSVIYLDEPTTGMDPAARRQLWNMLCRIRDSGKSIVLTSHSMEECEALCTRLAIMVNGEFKCIGSTQHLKNKFSKGLILKIKVRRYVERIREQARLSIISNEDERRMNTHVLQQNIQHVKDFVEREFSQAILQEEYQGILTFYIPLDSIKWSAIFGFMERNRNELNIEDYSISQTTLEEIFLEFAKHQKEDSRAIKTRKGCCCCCC